jgi:hypothetical protein
MQNSPYVRLGCSSALVKLSQKREHSSNYTLFAKVCFDAHESARSSPLQHAQPTTITTLHLGVLVDGVHNGILIHHRMDVDACAVAQRLDYRLEALADLLRAHVADLGHQAQRCWRDLLVAVPFPAAKEQAERNISASHRVFAVVP